MKKHNVGANSSLDMDEYAKPMLDAGDMLTKGNIDLNNRPVVKNKDGSISTVRSMSIGIGGNEYLIPTVSETGKVLSNSAAIEQFRNTGKHLGIFRSTDSATKYAKELHNTQEKMYVK